MASHDDTNSTGKRANGSIPPAGPGGAAEKPDWANGLKQLYDSVVEEPLPDSFRDLLDKLDDGDGGAVSDEGGPT